MPHDRIDRLKEAVQTSRPGVCTERAMIWTRYFKNRENRKKHPSIQMAEALSDVLFRKTIKIYPDELIVGNFSSKRVGGSIFPELHGVVVMQLLRWIGVGPSYHIDYAGIMASKRVFSDPISSFSTPKSAL